MPEAARRAPALLALLLLATRCAEEGPPASELRDIGALQRVVDQDPAPEALEIVDRVVDDERPVHAARLLGEMGLPAARRQVEIVEGTRLSTEAGRRFARRLVHAYRARVRALEGYQEVLEGGITVDPMDTLEAIRARREAEQELLAVVDEMTSLAPPTPRAAEPAEPPPEAPPEAPRSPPR